jgi:HTH-type transcriptional regulator, glycine betaine synthesis regulator
MANQPGTSAEPSRPPFQEVAEGESAPLTPLEREILDFFVTLAQGLGLPRSLGEIYGLAYASEEPISFAEVCGRLRLSKGSASQGLRTLTSLGALRPIYLPGDRRERFEPELSLKKLAGRFFADRITPHLDNGKTRLDRIEEVLEDESLAPTVIRRRIGSLRSWHRKAALFQPLLTRFLASGD